MVSDVTKAYAPDKQFLLLAMNSRIVAATMVELGMDNVNGRPTKNVFQRSPFSSNHNLPSKEHYLRRLATLIVDRYVLNSSDAKKMFGEVLDEEEQKSLANIPRLPDGRFPCRFEGCNKSFK